MRPDKSVKSKTLKYHFCINCGICKVLCPHNAIIYKLNKYKEYIPSIIKEKCTNCGKCSKYCPNTKEKFKKEAKRISLFRYPGDVGLEGADYFVAWSNKYRKSAVSGGVVTSIAKYLIVNKIIDGVVQVEPLYARKGELHYKVVLSSSFDEVLKNSGSAYQPVNYSEILSKLEKGKKYFIIGVPCVIRGINYLFSNNNQFKDIKIITCALICSHNVSQLFNDYFMDMHSLSDIEKWRINFRNKDGAVDASNFNSCIYTQNRTLYKENRFRSGWTRIWRNYWFAMEACNYCSDFWGYTADISVKDAWGRWENEKYGKSVAIVRSPYLKKIFSACDLEFENINYDEMHNMQAQTNSYKQRHAYEKNYMSPMKLCNRKRGMLHNVVMARMSKVIYSLFGYGVSSLLLPILDRLFKNH